VDAQDGRGQAFGAEVVHDAAGEEACRPEPESVYCGWQSRHLRRGGWLYCSELDTI
jgi:hypothetical protein